MIFKNGARLGSEAARRLAAATPHRSRCAIEPGLTDDEFGRIEREFGFEFADDHRMFLAAGLPVSVPSVDPPGVISTWREPWPDWRDGDREALRDRLDRPGAGAGQDDLHRDVGPDTRGQIHGGRGHVLDAVVGPDRAGGVDDAGRRGDRGGRGGADGGQRAPRRTARRG